MHINYVDSNVNSALPRLMQGLLRAPEVGSRNGRTKELTHVGITLTNPLCREVCVPERKANIAAQIAETAWVLAGRNDVEWLSHYLPRAKDFSDDGKVWRGGYGPRIRRWEGIDPTDTNHAVRTTQIDQLDRVVNILRKDPLSRRAVIAIYDPAVDSVSGLDIPCNDFLMFSSREGKLDLHVATRSNDIMWGWSGINAFEWSVLQEITAGMLGINVGALHFSINSLHLYDRHFSKAQRISEDQTHLFPEYVMDDSPRFDATGVDDTDALDSLLNQWFQVEQNIRDGNVHDSEIEDFPEPMFRSWLRVLLWWWTGGREHLGPLARTRLDYAARAGLQPPERKKPVLQVFTDGSLLVNGTLSTPHEEKSDFLNYAIDLHDEKHAAYGDSWKRRGEMLGILANIARKIDRLGGGDTRDETSADTAMDLMIYLAKYRVWLNSPKLSDDTREANSLLRMTEGRTKTVELVDPMETYLTEQFEILEGAVNEGHTNAKIEIVDDMLDVAYVLARRLWDAENGDDYRGADAD